MLKLFAAPDPAPSVAAMRAAGVLAQLLPGADDRVLAPLVHLEDGLGADPIRRLAALGDGEALASLRLSKAQMALLDTLRRAALGTAGAGELGHELGVEAARDALLLRAALLEQPLDPHAPAAIARGAAAVFPVTARDLMPAYSGPALGARLATLKARWIASDFSLSRADLLVDKD